MKKIISICLIFLVFILSLSFVDAIAYSTNITANEDSYTYNDSASSNYGNLADLYVRDNGDPERYDTYLEYIINDIPDNMTIDSVCLWVYPDYLNDSGKNVTIYYLDGIFLENLITWDNDYRVDILYSYNVSYEFNDSHLDKYNCIDITDLVDYSYSNDDALLDLILIGSDNTTGTIRFNSKEGTYPTFIEVSYSDDYTNFCQYNAFKNSIVTTCNSFYTDQVCYNLFDEGTSVTQEWITSGEDEYDIPPFIPHTITNIEPAFYFDKIEVWVRSNLVGGVGVRAFEVSVYSPETDTWYLLFNESDLSTKDGNISDVQFGGAVGGQTVIPYLKNVDTIYLGNLSISKVQVKVYSVLNSPDNLVWGELAFCEQGESESITDETDYSVAGVGIGCDTNDDCECALCEYGFCALRTTNMNCIINGTSRDDCCLSGSCSGGKCTKAGLWEGLDTSKTQQFGDTPMTNNFISLFFVIAISGFLMYYGNIIAGIFSLYMLSIFFAIVGWLSPFILIGMIITGLIALVFKIMVGQVSE